MKIPSELIIGGHKIVVRLVDNSDGEFSYNDYYNLIKLIHEKDTPEDNISEAFLHEILECIKCKNNLELDHTILTVLSEGLFQVIRSNNLDFRGAHV